MTSRTRNHSAAGYQGRVGSSGFVRVKNLSRRMVSGMVNLLRAEVAKERVMRLPKVTIEEVSDPAEIARFRAQDERHRRNQEWLEAHWSDLLPQARGRFLAVAGQEAFLADSPEEAWALAKAAHPEDEGAISQYVRPEQGPRIYAN